MSASEFDQLLATWSERLRRLFLSAFYGIKDAAQIGLITRMLENRDIDGALRAVNLDPLMFRDLDKGIGDAFEAGGRIAATEIPTLTQPSGHRLAIMFNARNPRAEAWLKDRSSTLVTQIVADQRVAIRQHLEAGMAVGQNPRDIALDLVGRISSVTGKREGGVIGLTASQEQWARNYAMELAAGDPAALTRALRDKRFDRTIAKAIKTGTPIPADLQAKMVATYRNRALKFRADTIGRTEALTSLNTAQAEAFRQGIDAGQIQQQHVRKIWRSAMDDRVRESHRVLNSESVGFNDAFVSPTGARLMHPGDTSLGATAQDVIQCRCVVQYRVDHLANVR